MVKLYSVTEMHALEIEANANGLSYELMMENAGKGIADEIEFAYSQLTNHKIIALVGSGNNGGDALVALFYLALKRWETWAYIVRDRIADDLLITRLKENSGQIISFEDDKRCNQLAELLESSSILLDGVLGTGIKLPLVGDVRKVLSFVKNHQENSKTKIDVVAIDCPSGVNCDTGETAPETIPAKMTITLAGIKNGLINFPAAKMTGEIRIASIGPIENLNSFINNNKIILTKEMIKKILPERPLDAHKGTFGSALIIAGSVNFTGAAFLAGLAAYRVGTGLVTLAVPSPLHESLAGQFPESTWLLLPHEIGVISADAARIVRGQIQRYSALLIGPGFGLEDTTGEFLSRLFTQGSSGIKGDIGFVHGTKMDFEDNNIEKPIVLDADGLKLMAKITNWPKLLPPATILTPHPGEMAVLTGLSIEEIQADRIKTATKYSSKWGHVVVLKGAFTIIAAPDGQIAVVPIASPALARAGTGDVLAGLIVGLRAQGVDAFQSACAGAWIHATAGVLAAKQMGNTASVIASDVLKAVPQVITDLQ